MRHNTTAARRLIVPMLRHAMIDLLDVVDNLVVPTEASEHVMNIISSARIALEEADIETMDRDPISDEDVAKMYLEGYSVLDVATRLGMSMDRAMKALKRKRIKRRKNRNIPHDRKMRNFLGSDPQRTTDMIAFWNEGETLEQIGQRYRITRERVRQVLTTAGVDTTNRPLTADQKKAVQEYLAGDSLVEVAFRHGVSPSCARNWVIRLGHEIRPSPRFARRLPSTAQKAKLAAKLYNEGVTVNEIAERLGYKCKKKGMAGLVYRYLAMEGITPNRRTYHRRFYATNGGEE